MERPNPQGGPQHAVFVDDTGRRARRAQRMYRTVAVLCLGALALLVVSLLNGVPLPGLTQPVPLPSNEPAHARAAAAAPPGAVAGTPGHTGARPSPVAVVRSGVGPGAVHRTRPAAQRPGRTAVATHPAGTTTVPTPGRHTTPASAASPSSGRRTTPAPATSPGSPTTGRQTTPPVAVTSAPATGRHTTPPTARQPTPTSGRHTTPATAATTHPSTGRHTTPAAPSGTSSVPRLL